VAFKILGADEAAAAEEAAGEEEAAAAAAPRIESAEFVSPARRWSSALLDGATPIKERAASAKIRSPAVLATNTHWMVRTRGEGEFRISELLYDAANGTNEIASADVPSEVVAEEGDGDARIRWLKVKCGASASAAALALTDWEQPRLEVRPPADVGATNAAAVILDILLAHGELPLGRREISLPATSFFHPDAGILNLAEDGGKFDGIRFRPGLDITTDALHGFHLPLDTGRWRVALDIESLESKAGGDFREVAPVGALRVRADGKELAEGAVSAAASSLEFTASSLAPVTVIFRYGGRNEIVIKRVAFTRLDGEQESTSGGAD
jgi:hypothetical protein